MSVSNASDPTYVLGRTDQETLRLQRQSQLMEPLTRMLFEVAGIREGMKVLDVGSGAGDVAFLAARMVGPTGSVVGVDNNPVVLETARRRASAAGLSNVSFIDGDMRTVALDRDFDAAVGRLILVHVGNQVEAVRAIAGYVRPGGIMAFQEPAFNLNKFIATTCLSLTTTRLYQQWIYWAAETFGRAGLDCDMDRTLPETFQAAGLPMPQMSLDNRVGCGEDWAGYEYMAECLRSVLPLIVRFGIATAEEVDVDTFAERMRAEVLSERSYVPLPLLLSVWTCKPC